MSVNPLMPLALGRSSLSLWYQNEKHSLYTAAVNALKSFILYQSFIEARKRCEDLTTRKSKAVLMEEQMISKSLRTIRIFVSSPNDVQEERNKAMQVIEQLQKSYARVFELKPVIWEKLPLTVDLSFQQGIDLVLKDTTQHIDIAVFILWSRLGSMVGPTIRKENGEEFRSGTERELYLMLKAAESYRSEHPEDKFCRPHIMAYVREDQDGFIERQRGKSDELLQEMVQQRILVKNFITETFQDVGSKSNIRAFFSYKEPVTFADRLRTHLKSYLDDLAHHLVPYQSSSTHRV
jgi:hypothetical protein